MKSASRGAYLSQKQMDAYTKQKLKAQSKKESQEMILSKESDQIQAKDGNDVIQPKNSDMIQPKAVFLSTVQELPLEESMAQSLKQDKFLDCIEESSSVVKEKSSQGGILGSIKSLLSFGGAKAKVEILEELSDDEDDERNRSMEKCDSDELDGELNLSDDEQEAQNFRSALKAKKKNKARREYKQEIDTNIFKIQFATLADKAEIATGDPVICKQCQAIFNSNSKTEETKNAEGNEQCIWKCEFCYTNNDVDLDEEEKPKAQATNYILEAAAQVQDKKLEGSKEISVIFCVDQSGSMCVSKAIDGRVNIKGDKRNKLRDFTQFGDGSDQYLEGERNVTYVSRMQCLQAAIDSQITDMGNGSTDRKVGLVAFNHEVTLIGDGTEEPQIIGGDKLDDYDYLLENGTQQGKLRMKQPVKATQKKLTEKLMGLEENGPTALGPAILSSIALAAEGATGSQVVICTDGLANIGLGAFDEAKTPEEMAKVEEFYERAGEFAKQKGITVNIVSIIGEECNLESLSKLAELTGGNIERVDPISLTKTFANSLAAPIIASNVVTKVKLHKGLMFRNELDSSLSEDKTLLVKDIGNVTADFEITFEYTLKAIKDLVKMEDLDLTKMKSFPFQTQITYKALDGSKCIRVITELLDISNDRESLEKEANFDLLGQNAMQKGSYMAQHGQHREAQCYMKNWDRKMKRTSNQTKNVGQQQSRGAYVNSLSNMYNQLGAQDKLECKAIDENPNQEKSMTGVFGTSNQLSGASALPLPSKSSHMNDELSMNMYQCSRSSPYQQIDKKK